MSFSDQLADAVLQKGSCLVVGLDPVLGRLPHELVDSLPSEPSREDVAQTFRTFGRAVIQEVAPHAVAIKPQIAFYEQWGPPGLEAYEDAVQRGRDAGLLVIADVKRGDIGSTAAAYAAAHLVPRSGQPHANAVTLNPYLGFDSISPFLDAAQTHDGGAFVLVRTSNPSAVDIQDLEVHGKPVYETVAHLVNQWGEDLMGECGYSSLGAVVGATSPEALKHIRSIMPKAWFLVPGVGAQGATAQDVSSAFDANGLGAVVNASRSILYAFGEPETQDWRGAIAEAAANLQAELGKVAFGTTA